MRLVSGALSAVVMLVLTLFAGIMGMLATNRQDDLGQIRFAHASTMNGGNDISFSFFFRTVVRLTGN